MEELLIGLASILGTLVVGQGAALVALFRANRNGTGNPGHLGNAFAAVAAENKALLIQVNSKLDGLERTMHEGQRDTAERLGRIDDSLNHLTTILNERMPRR